MAKKKKGKKKKAKKEQKLSKHFKTLAKELKASREKEVELVAAVEQLTEQVAALQSKIEKIPQPDTEPKANRRGTTPRGRRKTTKTKVATTKQVESPEAAPKPKKRGRPKKSSTPGRPRGRKPAAASTNGAESATTPAENTKVTREKKAKRTTPKAKSTGRGRPRKKKEVEGDDLTAISGLGASIDSLLRNAGITTYREMAKLSPSKFREILQGAGPRYKNKDPQPWIDAAARLATA